jgi:sodium-dependent dicarboxylate transporter 2/3/5
MFVLRLAVTCSFAFMLPVATPPNAIVYAASGMRTSEMMAAGSIMNVICVAVTVLGTTS